MVFFSARGSLKRGREMGADAGVISHPASKTLLRKWES
jgi:hypothetical protein